jgi:hypothetical protein
MVDMTYSTQYVREAPEIEAYKLGLINEARELYNQPMNLPAVEAAALSGTELQGIDFAKQGIGAFEPYIQAASQGVTQGMDLTQRGALAAGAIETAPMYQAAQDMMGRAVPVIGQGIGGILGSAQAYNPNLRTARTFNSLAEQQADPTVRQLNSISQQLSGMDPQSQEAQALRSQFTQLEQSMSQTPAEAYMNPYQQQVTQNALGEMRRQANIAQQGQAAQAIGAGAFGGTREGVQRAETERGIQDLMQQRIMQDYANNYAQAQQAAMQGFESQQQRQLAGGQALGQAGMQFGQLGQGIGGLAAQQAGVDINKAGTLGTLGGQMGSLGTQYGALGQATQQLGAADTGLLMGLGGLERQNEQAQIDAIRSTQMQESMAPYQQLGFVSDIYRGAPTTSMALTAQTAPSASPLQTAVGLGVGTLSTVAGAQKAGLF